MESWGYEFRVLIKRYGMKQRDNCAEHCTDTAFIGYFFHTLKGELIREPKNEKRDTTAKCLARIHQRFYNSMLMRSSIGYISPNQLQIRALAH